MNKQKASVLIIALIAIHTILILGAILFFIGRYHVAKTQADGYARNIALTALINFNNSKALCQTATPGNKYEIKKCRIKKAFNAIKNTTDSLDKYNYLISDPKGNSTASSSFSLDFKTFDELVSPTSNDKSFLTPGTWIDASSPNAVNCPGGTGPCFKDFARDDNGTPDPGEFLAFLNSDLEPNAFRIQGKLFPLGVLGLFGSGFLNIDSLNVRVDATSSVIPKRACFMVDVSNSTTYLSHAPYNYVNSCTYNNNGTFNCPLCPSANPLIASNRYCCPNFTAGEYGNYFAYPLNYDPNGLPLLPSDITRLDIGYACMAKDLASGTYDGVNFPLRHFRNNYQRFYTLDHNDYDSDIHTAQIHPPKNNYPVLGKTNDVYWVDVESNPEPLRTIFEGLNAAMVEFKAVAGEGSDKACVIFYDQNLVWPRMIKPTNLWDELIAFTDFSKTNSGSLASEVTEPAPAAKSASLGFKKAIRHGLFPYFTGNNDTGIFKPKAFTHTQGALEAALAMFGTDTQESNILTSDFLVLITDGMTNCINSNTCTNDYNDQYGIGYKTSMQRLKDYVRTTLVSRNVPLHILLVGDHVRPNNRCIKLPGNSKCATDDEWRALDPATRALYNPDLYHFIDTDNFNALTEAEKRNLFKNASEATPFSQVNRDYYELAVMTQGQFITVRKQENKNGTACTPNTPISFLDGEIIDVDPNCRSTAQQVTEALKDIVRFSPYAVVDVK